MRGGADLSPPAHARGSGGDRTYVWARLGAGGGTFSPGTGGGGGGAGAASPSRSKGPRGGVAGRKRGAPAGGAGGSPGETWGWAPGYYSVVGDSGGDDDAAVAASEENDGGGAVEYRFTLLDAAGTSKVHSLSEASAAKLLKSGDVVLANPWEGFDFANRLEIGGGNNNDNDNDNEYNYDDDSNSEDGGVDEEAKTSHLMDAPDESPPSDLIELTHLHEPSVVHALRYRYENAGADMSSIYTDTGPILIAVNPFKRDSTGVLYGDDAVKRYRMEGEGRWIEERGGAGGDNGAMGEGAYAALPPHVYAVADRVFRAMMKRLHPPVDVSPTPTRAPPQPSKAEDNGTGAKVNQSVLVSGESGAGKTVTTKLLMAYLSKLSEGTGGNSSEGDADETMSIEQRILESNPIMESFGNARTVRNDNSSRFGKYIEMKFKSTSGGGSGGTSSDGIPGAMLTSASIETYLLEKVRLVHQSPGERNYHIFYELFSMKNKDEDQSFVENIRIRDYDMEDFRLTNSSGTYDRRDGVVDASTFHDMKHAMSVMGFKSSEVRSVLEVTAALLHASNLAFEQVGSEPDCSLKEDNPHLEIVLDLLGIQRQDLNTALCYLMITSGTRRGSIYRRVLSMEQCENGVEALIKAVYGAIFQYLVGRINESVGGDGGKDYVKAHTRAASIGVLDIFGFESFQVNSFEQLCINYCNESLQQQFNGFVLRNEQEEYDREGIPWSYIEFPENQDVLDLIDSKGSGILHILHDMSRAPGASDKSFALAMYKNCSGHGRFEADSRQLAQQLFAIHHYAGSVEYNVEGFVEKTKDELPKSGSDLLLSSTNGFVKAIAEILQPAPAAAAASPGRGRGSGSSKRPTVGIQFSSQLHSLRSKIDATSPHYVRCLKPNDLLVPDCFDAALIADQLRSAGVIEAVRVSRVGYPQRFSHSQFVARYGILGKMPKKKNTARNYNPAKALLHSIKQRLNSEADIGIQVGKTKVFMRRNAYDLLEKMRQEQITSAAVTIQKIGRTFVCKKSYTLTLRTLLCVQTFVRKLLAAKELRKLRELRDSIILQRSWRAYTARKRLTSAKMIALWCQTHYRGSLGRQRYNELNRDRKALFLQSQWRGHFELKRFRKYVAAILVIQCARRCYSARVRLKVKKAEARDFSSVVQERDRLRHEIQKMKAEVKAETMQKSDDANRHDSGLDEKDAEIQSLRLALDRLSKEKDVADGELTKFNKELTLLKSEKDVITNDRDGLKKENELLHDEVNVCKEESLAMKKEFEKLKESYDTNNRIERDKVASAVNIELKHLREINEAMQKDYDQLKDQQSIPTSDHMEVELKCLEESNTSLMKDNDQLREELLKLKEENAAVLVDPGLKREDLDALKEDVRRLEREIKRLQLENETLQASDQDRTKIIGDLEAQNTQLKDEIKTLQSNAVAENAAANDELEMKCKELDVLKEAIKKQENQVHGGKLQVVDSKKLKSVGTLEAKANEQSSEIAGSETAKLWDEIGRLRKTPSSVPEWVESDISKLKEEIGRLKEISSSPLSTNIHPTNSLVWDVVASVLKLLFLLPLMLLWMQLVSASLLSPY